eukprot:6924992-Pyramimonas_sp.AAC.1
MRYPRFLRHAPRAFRGPMESSTDGRSTVAPVHRRAFLARVAHGEGDGGGVIGKLEGGLSSWARAGH